MGFGDLACQLIEGSALPFTEPEPHQKPFDMVRSRTMFVTGLFWSGAVSHCQQRSLEHFFPGREWQQVMKKVLGNSVLAPPNISITFTLITLQQPGKTWEDAKTKVANDMPRTFFLGSIYWPFVSVFNFRMLPLDARPLFASLAGVAWNVFVSSQANKKL